MFSIIGIVCHVCKKSLNDKTFGKDRHGDPLYYTDPKLNEFTDQLHYFCGPQCSTKWTLEQMEARKDVTQ